MSHDNGKAIRQDGRNHRSNTRQARRKADNRTAPPPAGVPRMTVEESAFHGLVADWTAGRLRHLHIPFEYHQIIIDLDLHPTPPGVAPIQTMHFETSEEMMDRMDERLLAETKDTP